MIANPVLRKVVEFQYTAVRTPLALLDRRLPETSSAHRVLDRGLHGLDGLVAGLLAGQPDYPPAQPQPHGESRPSGPSPEELEHEREQIAEAIRAEQPDVGELADPDLDVADVQAELRAKHLIEERLEQERRGR